MDLLFGENTNETIIYTDGVSFEVILSFVRQTLPTHNLFITATIVHSLKNIRFFARQFPVRFEALGVSVGRQFDRQTVEIRELKLYSPSNGFVFLDLRFEIADDGVVGVFEDFVESLHSAFDSLDLVFGFFELCSEFCSQLCSVFLKVSFDLT